MNQNINSQGQTMRGHLLQGAFSPVESGPVLLSEENQMNNLVELFEAMKGNDSRTIDAVGGGWSSSLPTFGGVEPEDTSEVWSWDVDSLIVGTCSDDLEIVSREEA